MADNRELALLLTAIDVGFNEAGRSAQIAGLITRKPDWRALDALAARHGLTPQLYRALAAGAAAAAAGDATLAILRPRYLANGFRCAQLTAELVRVVRRFDEAQVRVLAVKGPVLAMLAHGDVAMRTYGDIDLLVRAADVARAAEILVAAGYRPRTYDRDAFESGFFRNSADEFHKVGGFGTIDLHWRLGDWYFPFGPDEDAIWARTDTVNIDGVDVSSLAPADHLLFLCAHASKHGWPDLQSVADVAWLARAQPLDFDAVIAQASQRGCRRMLLVGLDLARRFARMPLPAAAKRLLQRDAGVVQLSGGIASAIRAGARPSALRNSMRAMATIERARDRIRYVVNLALMPTSGDLELVRLPRLLFPAYYLLRPVRLLLKAPALIGSRRAD